MAHNDRLVLLLLPDGIRNTSNIVYRLETAESPGLMHISPSHTKLARRKALAQYREKNKEELAEKSRIQMARHRARLREDPVALLKYQEHAREASANYEAKHREFRSWKRKLQRDEASYKRLGRDKRLEETRTGPRDYKMEWAVYQEKRKEKERERLADAMYVSSDHTVRIERDDGSFGYIYKY
ncbi:hypothetical protein DFH06DRAFT_1125106 [Mycena polygramma]|nr:hypothetical protein DFH06DRAFT_1125106 [Mycena polygramma]